MISRHVTEEANNETGCLRGSTCTIVCSIIVDVADTQNMAVGVCEITLKIAV